MCDVRCTDWWLTLRTYEEICILIYLMVTDYKIVIRGDCVRVSVILFLILFHLDDSTRSLCVVRRSFGQKVPDEWLWSSERRWPVIRIYVLLAQWNGSVTVQLLKLFNLNSVYPILGACLITILPLTPRHSISCIPRIRSITQNICHYSHFFEFSTVARQYIHRHCYRNTKIITSSSSIDVESTPKCVQPIRFGTRNNHKIYIHSIPHQIQMIFSATRPQLTTRMRCTHVHWLTPHQSAACCQL